MKIIISLLLFVSLGINSLGAVDSKAKNLETQPSNRELIDEIVVIVYGPIRVYVICQSDIHRMSIDGRRRSLQDLIIEELIYQDALKFKIPVDDDVVNKYILGIQKEHNLSTADVIKIFKTAGYSYEDGREALRIMYAVNLMMEHKIKTRLFISDQEIQLYYDAHPIYEQARYELQVAIVPRDKQMTLDEQKKQIMRDIKAGTFMGDWAESFWLQESEIAEDKQFITTMKPGNISKPQESNYGFEVYRLVNKKNAYLVPLKDRYKEIADILRQPKFEQLLELYKKELLNSAAIQYMHQ